MARTVTDTALMLSVLAGPDDRAPLSYAVDTREFTQAVKAPSVKGWRIAWTPDLAGLIPVDEEVARVAEGATRVFRSLGARLEAGCPDFSEVNDIVLGTRGVSMVANFAAAISPAGRTEMQKGLVWNIEQGLALTPQDIGRAETLRATLWQRVRAFMETRDLLILPTTSVPPFPVEQPYPDRDQRQAARQLHPVGLPDLRHHAHRPARHLGALRVHRERPARGSADRRAPAPGSRRAARGRRLRGRGAVGGPDPARRRRPPLGRGRAHLRPSFRGVGGSIGACAWPLRRSGLESS